jgi:hypothetical protein
MANIIKILFSNITSRVPPTLEDGQMAINQKDKLLFYRNDLGVTQTFNLGTASPVTTMDWIYLKLTADAISTATASANTLLSFLPDPNSHYEIEGKFFLESIATTTGVRPGISWPTVGLNRNVAWMISPISATTFASRFWGNTASANAASTAVPVANEGIYGEVKAMLVTAGSVTGEFAITLASEIAGSQVKINADSFIRYRKI